MAEAFVWLFAEVLGWVATAMFEPAPNTARGRAWRRRARHLPLVVLALVTAGVLAAVVAIG